ncbi:MAG: response regulator [Planctomycetes bacterium]|nr:response regulator [Planctomycetota bacterium]
MVKTLSTFVIAKMLCVDPGSVANWIDQGMLSAHRTPGGHRRVTAADLMKFLHEHKMPVPTELEPTPIRILVVDDDVGVAQLVARAIRTAHPDWEVVEANDGFQAGTLVATHRPNVVILNLRMPGIDGYEVCRLIKSQESTKHTEVLAMTAYHSEESEERILDCGARACMTKPLSMARLLKEVENSL